MATLESFYDVVIIGGGPVGASLAIALAERDMDVLVVDHQTIQDQLADTRDIRGYALSEQSRHFLEGLGVWDEIASHVCPIENISVTNGTYPFILSFGETTSTTHPDIPVGYIIEAYRLRHAVLRRAQEMDRITWKEGVSIEAYDEGAADLPFVGLKAARLTDGSIIQTRLLVGADGRASKVREILGIPFEERPYKEHALVTTIQHEKPHRGVAFECFYATGPFATLPMQQNRSAIVWSDAPDVIQYLTSADEETFLALLQERLQADWGALSLIAPRLGFPLGLRLAKTHVGPRALLVGDAAHVIHPLAGQGLNLGLRDVIAFTTQLDQQVAQGGEIGSAVFLAAYDRKRRLDRFAYVGLTDGLNRLFSNDLRTLSLLRGAGMRAFNALSPLKKYMAQQAKGLS